MRYRRIPSSRAGLRREIHDKNPGTRIAQGIFFLLLGAIIVFVNLHTDNSIQKTTGRIGSEYEHTVANAYDADWLGLLGSNDLYIFDRRVFSPSWNDNAVFKGQHVDIYYLDETPKRVVAIQLYDASGRPEQEFTTSYFKTHSNQPPQVTVAFIVGVCITIFGLCWFWWGIWLFATRRIQATARANRLSS
ncbi:MAG: hypothetical protein JO215_04450 [Ktedonobacteraceae bacterium]|nr:hypothetical protein [Ktedonobacteraceae bacterium]MBV9711427.1 hypothetical protein [Ktedonobacteraceae bacterium]